MIINSHSLLELNHVQVPRNLLYFFEAARLLRLKDVQAMLRKAATSMLRPSLALLSTCQTSQSFDGTEPPRDSLEPFKFSDMWCSSRNLLPCDVVALRCAVEGELDRDGPQRMIHVAASLGDLPLLQALASIARSAKRSLNVNCFTLSGETPAMLAAAAGHAPALRFLMRNQADVAQRSRCKNRFTALDYAIANRHDEVARLLQDPLSLLA